MIKHNFKSLMRTIKSERYEYIIVVGEMQIANKHVTRHMHPSKSTRLQNPARNKKKQEDLKNKRNHSSKATTT
jgi:hypothetical protein